MAGIITVETRIATAGTQFTTGSPVVNFAEYTLINQASASFTARIIGYAYNSGATVTPTVVVTLRRPGGANADQFIVLENRTGDTGNVTNFTTICGSKGLVVPKQFGVFGTVIPPVGNLTTGESYQLFVSTTGKNSAASFICWFSVDED